METKLQGHITSYITEDDSCLIQHEPGVDKTLKFGPLETTIYDLYDKGWKLKCSIPRKYRLKKRFKIHLYCGSEVYKVGSLPKDYANTVTDFASFIKDGSKVSYGQHIKETFSWDILHKKYPRKKKPPMIGNQSLREFVLAQIR